MKIGYDAKRLFFNGSGLGNYSRSTVDMVARLAPEGTTEVLFSPSQGNRHGFELPSTASVIYPSKGLMRRFSSIWRTTYMGRDIQRAGVDLYHGLSHELPADIATSGARSVVTIHDLIFVHHPELYKAIDRAIYIKKYRSSCMRANRIIAISEQTKNDLVEHWQIDPDKIDVVYQGCNPMFYTPATEDECEIVRQRYSLPSERFILSVGTVERRKNLRLTLEAMVSGHITTPLVSCGRWTPYKDELEAYAASNGISHLVHWHNDIDFADLPAIYRMAGVTVYASLFEGFGIPILEAMNSGTPVITSQGGVFPETGGDACRYVDSGSVSEMTQALSDILAGGATSLAMVERGHKQAMRFREEVIFPELWRSYQKAML